MTEKELSSSQGAQMKLDKTTFSFRKFRLKTTKHALWIIFAGYTGFTFVTLAEIFESKGRHALELQAAVEESYRETELLRCALAQVA